MPFVQITTIKGKAAKTKQAISEAIHKALIEEFSIPQTGKFQVINEVAEDNLIFPQQHLNLSYSKDIVFIYIVAKQGRTAEMKQKLFAKIAELIHQGTNISKDDIFIVLSDSDRENWSFGKGKAQLLE